MHLFTGTIVRVNFDFLAARGGNDQTEKEFMEKHKSLLAGLCIRLEDNEGYVRIPLEALRKLGERVQEGITIKGIADTDHFGYGLVARALLVES